MFASVSEFSEIELYVLGDLDHKIQSNVSIINSDLFRNGLPHPGGIYDPHMGTTDQSWNCQTCFNRQELCPGHPGSLKLNYPVLSPIYIKEIIQWLKVICFKCGKLIVSPTSINLRKVPKHKILGEYVKIVKGKKCIVCGEPHPHVIKDRSDYVSIQIKYENEELQPIYPHEIIPIFERISDETMIGMGKPPISHPRKLILNILRIPSNTIRPDVKKIEGGQSRNDDLTVLIQNIVKLNNKFGTVIPDVIDEDLAKKIHNLNLLVFEFIKGTPATSTKRGVITNTKRPLVSLAKRMPRKFGRMRRNLLGKRVKLIGRGVISNDPSLKLDEVGLPLIIAKNLQIPEIVTEYNRDRLMIYFMNGTKRYPGCKKIKKKYTGREHWVDNIAEDFELEMGDTIYRDLITGDQVYFNRQPSLEATSILSHRVVVLPKGDTIRLNVLSCPFYNAD